MTTKESMEMHHNQPEYSVSELSGKIKRTVEDAFGYVRVRGEISGCKRAASGHIYMDLKDEKALINGVCWKGVAHRLAIAPEDGLEVICSGRISTFPGRSNYQLVIDQMELAGAGALMALLEKRKHALAAEGLFAQERKKQLPYLPRRVGVVTSPTGAVIRDILHRISDRFPIDVIVWPVIVQGKGAERGIAEAIRGFNQFDGTATPEKPDIVIVARGGGSMEDLWCFNEEEVVRAVAASDIPLISAVGHETDTTLIDLVADRRAPTPTAAAEMAVPVLSDLRYTLHDAAGRLDQSVIRHHTQRQQRLEALSRGLLNPAKALEDKMQRADEWSERLDQAMKQRLTRSDERYMHMIGRLRAHVLLQKSDVYRQRIDMLTERLQTAWHTSFQRMQEHYNASSRMLELLSHQSILKRGFSYVTDKEGQLVSAAAQMPETAVTLHFHDGTKEMLSASASRAEHSPVRAKPKKSPKKRVVPPTQQSLF